jgi:peptide chain release factor subunit 3
MIRKENINIVFIGHVDAGKSTICGQLLLQNTEIDPRHIEKCKEEAINNKKPDWWIPYLLDTNPEERERCKTFSVGYAYFETDKRKYTILDTPGHQSYVFEMIQGASQADIAILIVSARTNEFETGFLHGGQTREHAVLAKTLGVSQIIVLINKMDLADNDRVTYIIATLDPFMKQIGFKSAIYIPVSGQTGLNLSPKNKLIEKSFLEVLDEVNINRGLTTVLRIPIAEIFKEDGKNYVTGKVETGKITIGQKINIMQYETIVKSLSINYINVSECFAGDFAQIEISSIDNIHAGFVIADTVLKPVNKFIAHILLINTSGMFCTGYSCVLHIHHIIESVNIKLMALVDKKTGMDISVPAYGKKDDMLKVLIECSNPICIEKFSDIPQLGRFTLRDKNTTIAMGKVIMLPKSQI